MPTPLAPPAPVLVLHDLMVRFGAGCDACVATTGAERETSTCRECGAIVALAGIDLEVGPGEVLGIVGESGSGKTTLLRCLHMEQPVDRGRADLAGAGDILALDGPARRALRNETVAMVHQDATAAGLLGQLAAESNVADRLLGAGEREFGAVHRRAVDLMNAMEIPRERHAHLLSTFSGGMRQRVQLARALVRPPQLLLLDEPTTGLDPSVQARLLELLERVVDGMSGATVLVSHDLGVVRLLADRVLVLRYGRIVESGLTDRVLGEPQHPYGQLLVASQLR